MKKILVIALIGVFTMSAVSYISAEPLQVVTTTKKVIHKTKRGTKTVARKTRRGGKRVYHRTKRGTVWTYRKVKRGGKWVWIKVRGKRTRRV